MCFLICSGIDNVVAAFAIIFDLYSKPIKYFLQNQIKYFKINYLEISCFFIYFASSTKKNQMRIVPSILGFLFLLSGIFSHVTGYTNSTIFCSASALFFLGVQFIVSAIYHQTDVITECDEIDNIGEN